MRVRANGLPHNLSVSDCLQHWMEPAVVRLRSATYVLLFPSGTSMRHKPPTLLAGTLEGEPLFLPRDLVKRLTMFGHTTHERCGRPSKASAYTVRHRPTASAEPRLSHYIVRMSLNSSVAPAKVAANQAWGSHHHLPARGRMSQSHLGGSFMEQGIVPGKRPGAPRADWAGANHPCCGTFCGRMHRRITERFKIHLRRWALSK
jgi:hypothetical protein